MQLRVFNYNTHEKVHSWDAHSDYIRCIAVHPTLPYVLSGSDDMTIRLWDWDKNWKCMQVPSSGDSPDEQISMFALDLPANGYFSFETHRLLRVTLTSS